tara:strand:- start:297 stop:422 length:126 start_codon:yes stop_codon:yes gene_type:complete
LHPPFGTSGAWFTTGCTVHAGFTGLTEKYEYGFKKKKEECI